MGIKGLDDIIKNIKLTNLHPVKTVNLQELKGKRVCFDASEFFHRSTNKNPNAHVSGFFNLIVKTMPYIQPVFVFDGKPPKEKQKTLDERRKTKERAKDRIKTLSSQSDVLVEMIQNIKQKTFENSSIDGNQVFEPEDYEDLSAKVKLLDTHIWQPAADVCLSACLNNAYAVVNANIENNSLLTLNGVDLTADEIVMRIQEHIDQITVETEKAKKKINSLDEKQVQDIKNMLECFGIPYIHIELEADIVCAMLVKHGVVDYCIGNDMDLLAFGCPRVIRNINFSDDNVDIYTTENIINALDLTKSQFIDLCIILGCDYTDRLIGIKNAFGLALIKKYGSIEKIIDSMEEINVEHRRQYLEKYPGVTEPPYCIKVGEDFNYQKARSLFNIAFNPEFITSLISPSAFDNIAETCRKIRMNPNRYSEVIEFCISHCIGLNKQLITRKLAVILNIEWINDKSDDSYMEGKFEKVSKRKFNLLGNHRAESADRPHSMPIACQRKPGFTRVEFGSSPGHSAAIAWC